MNEAQDGIIHYLTMLREVRAKCNPPPGFHYKGMEDFLLQYGR